jgi:hypothetical protein
VATLIGVVVFVVAGYVGIGLFKLIAWEEKDQHGKN